MIVHVIEKGKGARVISSDTRERKVRKARRSDSISRSRAEQAWAKVTG